MQRQLACACAVAQSHSTHEAGHVQRMIVNVTSTGTTASPDAVRAESRLMITLECSRRANDCKRQKRSCNSCGKSFARAIHMEYTGVISGRANDATRVEVRRDSGNMQTIAKSRRSRTICSGLSSPTNVEHHRIGPSDAICKFRSGAQFRCMLLLCDPYLKATSCNHGLVYRKYLIMEGEPGTSRLFGKM